jgi:hypothetical protein
MGKVQNNTNDPKSSKQKTFDAGVYFVQPLQGCKSFVNFTTGFGLRPPPAAIIVMTPSGSGEIKLCERLQKMG